ncbi:MAG: heat shock protein HspQ, partial [Henriciella sp.]
MDVTSPPPETSATTADLSDSQPETATPVMTDPVDTATKLEKILPKPAHIAPASIEMRHAKYQIGQIVRHRLFDFYGIIFDVDPVFSNTDEWYE